MREIEFNERMRLASLLDNKSQKEVMGMIPQFHETEEYNNPKVPKIANPDPGSINVLMLNMERGMYIPELCDFLNDNPDIVPFDVILANELDDGCFRTKNLNTARVIADELDYNFAWGLEFIELVDERNKKGHHGNAVFSRYPILRSGVMRLPEEYNWYFDRQRRIGGRHAIYAVLDFYGKEVAVVSIHLENRTDGLGRKRQMDYILDEVKKLFPDIPVILGGDLNTNCLDGRALDGFDPTVQSESTDEAVEGIRQIGDMRKHCFDEVYIHEPLLNGIKDAGYEIVPKEAIIATRRKPMPDGSYLPLALDWVMVKNATFTDFKVISTETKDFTFAKPGSALSKFDSPELSDHNGIWASVKIN